jgi:hypothetical protein
MIIEPRPGGGTVVRIQIPELQDPSAPGRLEDGPETSSDTADLPASPAAAWRPE